MGGGGSAPPPVEVNQCDVMENQMKQEYGDDFRTNREKFPLTSEVLGFLAGTPCKDHFNYSSLVNEFCAEINNFDKQVGSGQQCADLVDRSVRSRWCLMSGEGQQDGERLKTDPKCTSSQLGDQYHPTATSYCQSHANDRWCACYNLKNKVCTNNPNAAGCGYYKQLEDNRAAFGQEPKIEDPKNPGEMIECSPSEHGSCPYSVGYTILKENAHCRPRSCDSGYIPENVKSDCAPSYNFCDKDLNIQSMTNNNIVVECNGPNFGTLPDWWDEEFDDSFFDDDREPPFDTFPLNKLPITRFPKKFDWKNRNVRYLTYGGVGSVSSCCCCMLLLLMLMRRR